MFQILQTKDARLLKAIQLKLNEHYQLVKRAISQNKRKFIDY